MRRLLLTALVLVLCIGLLCSCGTDTDKADETTVADTTVTDNAEETTAKMKSIHTPFADLKVSEDFFENVEYEEAEKSPYTLVFRTKADKTDIFTLIFGGEGDALMGTLIGEKENTVIYMNFAELDSNSENYQEYCAYQEGINDIINGLVNDYQFVVNQVVEYEDNTTFDIKTSVVTMKYPNKWKEKVKIDVTEESVKFSNDGTPLFDLIFKECDGYLLGTYKDTPIYIVDYLVDTDEQAAMQEDVNVILQHLMEDSNFKINY